MGKLAISQELSDKISNSLRIKQTDIDTGANKPIIRKIDSPPRQQTPKYSPIKKKDSPIKKQNENLKQPEPKDSPIKKQNENLKQPEPIDSPIKKQNKHPMAHPKKLHKTIKNNDVNYMKISKIVFISSIIGGIGITLGIKIGTILFL